MDYQSENNHIVVNCGQRLELEGIQIQKDVLVQVLAAKKSIVFHAAELNKVDTPSLQLLLSFIRVANEQNISWEWQEPSNVLIQTANLLGIQELLKLPKKVKE